MKNELILAKYTGQKKRASGERLRALLQEFGVEALMGPRYPLLNFVESSGPWSPPSQF